jgi:putative transposase
MRRLKQLEEESTRLRRFVADLSLDKEMLQDVVRRKLGGLRALGRWWTISELPGG